jgi:hypothetical protein
VEWPEFVEDILSVAVRVRPNAVDGLHTFDVACRSPRPVEPSDPSWIAPATGAGPSETTVGIYLWGYLFNMVTGAKWVAPNREDQT